MVCTRDRFGVFLRSRAALLPTRQACRIVVQWSLPPAYRDPVHDWHKFESKEREQCTREIYEVAAAVEQNLKSQVLASIYAKPTEAVRAAEAIYEKSEFKQASITKLHSLEITGPNTARKPI